MEFLGEKAIKTHIRWHCSWVLDLEAQEPAFEWVLLGSEEEPWLGICVLKAWEEPGPWLLRGNGLGFPLSELAEGPLWGPFPREGVPTVLLLGCTAASPSLSRKGLGHPFPQSHQPWAQVPLLHLSRPLPLPSLSFPSGTCYRRCSAVCPFLPRSLSPSPCW